MTCRRAIEPLGVSCGSSPRSWCAIGRAVFMFMIRFALSGAVALIFAIGLLPAGVSAQSEMDCAAKYKSFMEKMARQEQRKLSGEEMAAMNRKAQRIFDACQTGHMNDPRKLFEELDRRRN